MMKAAVITAVLASWTMVGWAARRDERVSSHVESVSHGVDSLSETAIPDTFFLYTVMPHDNLWGIAQKTLGDPSEWVIILKANPVIEKSGMIHPGQKLKIPVMKGRNDSAGKNANGQAVVAQPKQDVEIPGLVVDRTRSPIGEQFFRIFNQDWNPPSKGETHNITIEEKPLPGLGALVLVKVDESYVFKKFLQPRYDTVKKAAEAAAAVVSNYVENYREIQRNLEGKDMSGTGIY